MSKLVNTGANDASCFETPNITDMTLSSMVQEVNNLSQNASAESSSEIKNDLVNDVTTKSPLKKNVSFPCESPIAGYLDPPDPWKNAPQWTSVDLVNSYRASCKKHNTKPLISVLNQLQMIENVGERYAILSLKGEKIDMKNVETLEEIFKLVQFQCVDLEGTHLDEETSVAIFEMIEYYESACKVNLSFNKNISIRGWQACSRMIRKTPDLTFLDARNCDINERVLPVLGRALKMGCFLKILHLENTNMSGRPLVILVAALKMNEILKELFLADNKLMPSDGIQIGSLLKYNHTMELLDLRNNHLQDIGVGHICDGLYEQNLYQGLNTLVLWNNLLTYQSMLAVARALTSTKNLETLNIGHNSITNEGMHQLKEGLLQNKSLLRLGLQGTKITCEGAVALAEVIADSPRLLRVDLRENEIKTAGMMALSLALKVNNILHRLDMDKDTKKEAGIKDYADQQKRLQQEINSKLEQNRDLFYKSEQEKSSKEKEENLECEKQNDKNVPIIEPYIKVRRPQLLLMPDCSREASLDSPHTVEPTQLIPPADSFINPELLPSPQYNQSISTPPGDLLLSPQYCPTVKARKIFTVSKVNNSPKSPMTASILPPVLELPMALPPSLSVVMNNIPNEGLVEQSKLLKSEQYTDITNVLVTESVNQILDQIISDTTSGDMAASASSSAKEDVNLRDVNIAEGGIKKNIPEELECGAKNISVDDTTNNVSVSDGPDNVENVSVDEDSKENISGDDEDATKDVLEKDKDSEENVSVNEDCKENALEVDKDAAKNVLEEDKDPKENVSVEDEDMPKIVSVGDGPDNVENISVGYDTDNVENISVGYDTDVPIGDDINVTKTDSIGDDKDNIKICSVGDGTDIIGIVQQPDIAKDTSGLCSETVVKSSGCDNDLTSDNVQFKTIITNNSDSEHLLKGNKEQIQDSGVGSYDNEQWTNVGETVKPDFQTSLTLNGLTQELASAIEGLDVSSDSININTNAELKGSEEVTSFSSPDDFEKELDEMLAKVTKGNSILSGLAETDSVVELP